MVMVRMSGMIFSLVVMACISAIGSGGSQTILPLNVAPVSSAGPNRDVPIKLPVNLDGTSSSDANHDALSYRWTFVQRPAGSNAVLHNANTARPDFTPDVAGIYVVGLTVSDGALDSNLTVAVINASAITAVRSSQMYTPSAT